GAIPQPPNWLTEVAKKTWVDLYPTLDQTRMQTGALHTLALYCAAWAQFRDAEERLNTMGVVLKDGMNRIVENPYVKIRETAVETLHTLGESLGIRPDIDRPPRRRLADVVDYLTDD